MQLNSAKRLAVLKATGLLDTPPEAEFDRITRLAARMLKVPVALMTLVDNERQFFKSRLGVPDDTTGSSLAHSLCKEVVESGAPFLVSDIKSKNDTESLFNSYAGVPLATSEREVIGAFCVLDVETREWSQDDIDALCDLAAMIMTEVELRMALAEERRLRQENDGIARALQAALLPPILPELSGIDIAAAYLPQGNGNLVGGDFYDVFEANEKRSHIVVGDVCGKGFLAARTSLLVRHVFRAAALRGDDSASSFRLVDEALRQQEHPFVATQHAVVERRNDLVFCDITIAGLPLPILVRDGKAEVIGQYGTVLGADLGVPLTFGHATCELGEGDVLLMFTDGVTDNPEPVLTELQLRDALTDRAVNGANTAVNALLSIAYEPGTSGRPPADDIAIVAISNPGDLLQ